MNYTIENEYLTVVISDAGAELQSIQTKDGTEYLWQADKRIWGGKAPNLFPYIARLTEGKYYYQEKEYEMKIHGIVKYSTLTAEEQKKDAITFCLNSSEEIQKQYPFTFSYRITYQLEKNCLVTWYTVENRDNKTMYFGVGGHPGFRAPLEEGLKFEDYVLEFGSPAHPYRIGFNDACAVTGMNQEYKLMKDTQIALRHDLFDHDAIVLQHADRTVTLKSEKGSRRVTVSYPDFPYIGFWHMPHKEAEYVCVEPWSSLPSRAGIIERLEQQSDLIHLEAGKTWETRWTITIQS